ncbi:peptidoglycan-binding protein [Streptomyces sp. CA-243310]|uniref:peptidoglycan-binding protein n=1 Tax=Streptomyces sp. CA-243310 TaxID=3240056 RepID=UPI003D949909
MRRRRGWLLASLAVLLAASGGGYVVLAGPQEESGRSGDRRADGLPPATAPVKRGDLSSGLQVEGTLGYAKERRQNAVGPGVLTWTAAEGSVVERDGRLYEVDGRAVRLMYGATPMYRPLKGGDKGEDVKQLKQNLLALGYGTGLDASDGAFTAGTTAGVKRWQKAHGQKETGEVAKEAVAFASGPQRIRKNDAAVGDEAAPGKPVLTLTGTRRSVRFALDVAKAGSVKTGEKVSIDLPGGGTAGGTVESVGSTAHPDDPPGDGGGGAGGGSGGDKPKVEVTVALDAAAAGAEGPDRSPVTVRLTGETRKGVLSVPVNSLLALTGGGFGVQVVEGGAARDVRVDLGMFGQGRVEVTGGSLKEGMRVGVPTT